MQADVAIATAPRRRPAVATIEAVRRFDWFDYSVLALFAAVSMWVLAQDLYQVIAHHRTWTGTDGLFLADQMQYLAWIQDASKHFLVSDMFVLRSTPHDYFQPIVVISAGIHLLGVATWLSLLLWKPIAVAFGFYGVWAFTRYLLPDTFDRRVALVLALFFGAWGVLGDEWMPFWSWGYPFGLIAIAAVAVALVSYDRARVAGRRFTWVPALMGLIASFTHPWQGEVLILIVIATEAITFKRGEDLRRRLVLPVVTVIATGLPLLYYEILYRLDSNWTSAQEASKHVYSLWGIVWPLVPLLIFAVWAYRRRPDSFIAGATRMWPLAALAIFGFSETGVSGTPLHAFAGVTIPLAVLAVQGAHALGIHKLPRWRVLAVVLVAAGTIPATIYEFRTSTEFIAPRSGAAEYISGSDQTALNYLASDPRPGGVLARQYIGLIVPAETGRKTYVGSGMWSEPDRGQRAENTLDLFTGKYAATRAQSFVRSTSARFVLKDCLSPDILPKLLGPMIVSSKQFGCAAVYRLR